MLKKRVRYAYFMLALATLLLVFVAVVINYKNIIEAEPILKEPVVSKPLPKPTTSAVLMTLTIANAGPELLNVGVFSNYSNMSSNTYSTNFNLGSYPDVVTIHVQANVSDANSVFDITHNGFVKFRLVALEPDGTENSNLFDTGYIKAAYETSTGTNNVNGTFYRPFNIHTGDFSLSQRSFKVLTQVFDGTSTFYSNSTQNIIFNITKVTTSTVDSVDLSLYTGENVSFFLDTVNLSIYLQSASPTAATCVFYSTPTTLSLTVGEGALIDEDGDNYYDYLVTLKSIIGDTARYKLDKIRVSYTPTPGVGAGGGGGAEVIIKYLPSGPPQIIVIQAPYPQPTPEKPKPPVEEVPGVIELPPELKKIVEEETRDIIELMKYELKIVLADMDNIENRVDAKFSNELISKIKYELQPIIISDATETQKEGQIDRVVMKYNDFLARDIVDEEQNIVLRYLTKNNIGLFFKHNTKIKEHVKTFAQEIIFEEKEQVKFKFAGKRYISYMKLENDNIYGEIFPPYTKFVLGKGSNKRFDIDGDTQEDIEIGLKNINGNLADVEIESLITPIIIHTKTKYYGVVVALSKIPDIVWFALLLLLVFVITLLVSMILKGQKLADIIQEKEENKIKNYIAEYQRKGYSEEVILKRITNKIEDYIYKTREAGYSDLAIKKKLMETGLKEKYINKLMKKTRI